jgi:hypothetical protein
MRAVDDPWLRLNSDSEMERLRRGVPETEHDPDDTWKAPARPVVFFFTCLLGWAAVVGAVIYLLLG